MQTSVSGEELPDTVQLDPARSLRFDSKLQQKDPSLDEDGELQPGGLVYQATLLPSNEQLIAKLPSRMVSAVIEVRNSLKYYCEW